jgi:hypothetical protein
VSGAAADGLIEPFSVHPRAQERLRTRRPTLRSQSCRSRDYVLRRRLHPLSSSFLFCPLSSADTHCTIHAKNPPSHAFRPPEGAAPCQRVSARCACTADCTNFTSVVLLHRRCTWRVRRSAAGACHAHPVCASCLWTPPARWWRRAAPRTKRGERTQ